MVFRGLVVIVKEQCISKDGKVFTPIVVEDRLTGRCTSTFVKDGVDVSEGDLAYVETYKDGTGKWHSAVIKVQKGE